jgi:hypothetical protein
MSSVKWAPGAVLARWTSVNGHGRLESNAASATTPKKTTAVPKPSVLAMARHTVHRIPIESRIMRASCKAIAHGPAGLIYIVGIGTGIGPAL